MDMTPDRWDNTNAYMREVFGKDDDQLATLMDRAIAAGIPAISVSPEVGVFLQMLVSTTNNGMGAMRALELGTLAGYSSTWLSKGLAPDGKLITVELEPKHADFAQSFFDSYGIAQSIELHRGKALDVIDQLNSEFGPASFDVVFADAVKREYPEYVHRAKPLVKVGGLFIMDNALGAGWWIDETPGSNPDRDAADEANRMLANDPDFLTACVPLREGITIAKRIK
ncbi:MAG: O-methyltransferase [Phycisphaeraceae bacterium]|nr:O-methyltransferase [Phycisphaerales bacterium]MCB9859329.1 O-methyltransferase [Phycisphaeraceae bacterium]